MLSRNRQHGVSSTRSAGPSVIGTSPLRREDDALIRGIGRFVADIRLEGALHVAFVRSTKANGMITGCDLGEALRAGASGVFCGDDLGELSNLPVNPVLGDVDNPGFPVLAQDTIRAVGQPVAAVLAETPEQAADLAELVHVEIDGLSSSSTEGERVAFSGKWADGNVNETIGGSDHVVSVTVQHSLVAPSPMENRGIAVEYNAHTGGVHVWLSTQTPHRARKALARILSIDPKLIHVTAPDVGGAFGMKASLYPEEVFAVWAALKLKRSVRWISTRSEDLQAASHGRGIETHGKLAVSDDGCFQALIANALAPVGSWLTNSSAIPAWNAMRILPGPYNISDIDLTTSARTSPTAPVGIYRGAGRPEAAMLMERLVEKAARQLGIDPMDLRRRNLLPSSLLPHTNAAGAILDSGRYELLLDRLIAISDYGSRRNEIAVRQSRGELAGIGACFFVEPCGSGWESASVTCHADGRIVARVGGSSQGHGRETAYAQIVADAFDCDMGLISILHGDSSNCPDGIGALASRSTAIGGSALLQACLEAKEQLVSQGFTSGPIEVTTVYSAPGEAWGYGCYLAQVSIDPETGEVTIEALIGVDDAGRLINPKMVEGQLLGGIAQGIGEVLMERVVYDDDGQLQTGSLMDYALPRANDIPAITLDHMETSTEANLLGSKGVGEAGTIGAPAAIFNAVADALHPIGIEPPDMPLTPNRLWHAIHDTKEN